MMHAIPTVYRDVRFRSRLEATWAAFFDQVRWPWKYEPIDLNGYIPDFILPWDGLDPVLVEVKPLLTPYALANQEAIDKIEQSGWEHGALIVGVTPMIEPGRRNEHRIIGWGTTYWEDWRSYQAAPDEEAPTGPWSWFWRELVVCNHCEWPSFALSSDEFCMRCCGGGSWLDSPWAHSLAIPILPHAVDAAWARAQNQTQWRGRGDELGEAR
jgi:hypothetical protein